MTAVSEATLRVALSEEFAMRGLAGRGNIWRWSAPGLRWVVHLDRNAYGRGFGLELGLYLGEAKKSPPMRDCDVVLYAEMLPLGDGIDPHRALDLDRPSPTKVEDLRRLAGAIADYVQAASTLAVLREKYAQGEFASSFVTKEAAAVLGQ